jgi:hypothetical protein
MNGAGGFSCLEKEKKGLEERRLKEARLDVGVWMGVQCSGRRGLRRESLDGSLVLRRV